LLVRQRYKSFHLIFPKGEAKQKEMGHLHGERLADLPFPVEIKKSLVSSGQALPHHIYPESGWVSYWIRRMYRCRSVLSLYSTGKQAL
jgi:luciferase-like monooxygenase